MPRQTVTTFRLPRSYQTLLVGSAVLVALPYPFLFSFAFGTFVVILVGVLAVLALRFYTVQVHRDGVQLYGLWRLRWTDVTAATYRMFLGLPYLHVERRTGFAWWLPLYFVGERDLLEALVNFAPADHPFRSVRPNKALHPPPSSQPD